MPLLRCAILPPAPGPARALLVVRFPGHLIFRMADTAGRSPNWHGRETGFCDDARPGESGPRKAQRYDPSLWAAPARLHRVPPTLQSRGGQAAPVTEG